MGGVSTTPRTGHFTPGKATRYPFYGWLGGPQGRSGRDGKMSPLVGFEPQTVQPVASRYTDYTKHKEIRDKLGIFNVHPNEDC